MSRLSEGYKCTTWNIVYFVYDQVLRFCTMYIKNMDSRDDTGITIFGCLEEST